MYAVSFASSGPWTSPAMKSAHVCAVPSSGGRDGDTYTFTTSPVAAVVGPPDQLVAARARAGLGATSACGIARASSGRNGALGALARPMDAAAARTSPTAMAARSMRPPRVGSSTSRVLTVIRLLPQAHRVEATGLIARSAVAGRDVDVPASAV